MLNLYRNILAINNLDANNCKTILAVSSKICTSGLLVKYFQNNGLIISHPLQGTLQSQYSSLFELC
jgi:hypothetical protein